MSITNRRINCHNPVQQCDFCEEKTASRPAHQTDCGLFLCPDCLHYMENLPGSIGESLERFLVGNVV